MLWAHLSSCEAVLVSQFAVAANAGSGVNKGTPREAFVGQFLESHLSERLAVGQGEVIDCDSKTGETRPQMDVVVYHASFPRLQFGGEVCAFLAESVVATLEVKSTLSKEEMRKSILAAAALKRLRRNLAGTIFMGYMPPSILSYVVAYGGPKMGTVHSWLEPLHAELGIDYPEMRGPRSEWHKQASPSVDAVFVLGQGFALFNNLPFRLLPEDRYGPRTRWTVGEAERGSLAMLFLLLLGATVGVAPSFDQSRYVANWVLPSVRLGE
jgi:hypothetical protein